MANWRVTFEIDLPTESEAQVAEWARFVLGSQAHLRSDNPCRHLDLPAGDRLVSAPSVSNAE